MKAAVVAVLLAGLGLTGCAGLTDQPGGPGGTASGTAKPDNSCLTVAPRHLEVCTAYVANATVAARYPYYQIRHADTVVGRAAVSRLRSRYTGAAYQFLVRQTASWPADVRVRLPSIHIDSLSVSADENTAVLHTHETWRVETDSGRALFAENNKAHTITMRRVPGVVLHKWVVTDIR